MGGYISGGDNKFTIFISVEVTINANTADALFVLSGKMTATGIEDFYYANFMVDDKGDPLGDFIENGEGRVIYDSDGFSPTTTLIKSANVKTGGSSANGI